MDGKENGLRFRKRAKFIAKSDKTSEIRRKFVREKDRRNKKQARTFKKRKGAG